MKRLATALLLVACERRAVTTIDASPPPAASASSSIVVAPVDDASVDPCATWAAATPTAAKSIGHTSIVFKLDASGAKAAWKPSSKRGKERWRGEIAAYRLGEALGIPNVPLACPKTISAGVLKPLLPAGALDEVIVRPDGMIDGAVIPWIEGLQFLDVEKDAPRRDKLAAQLSTLAVFDAITGNWDRYSGGNVGLDASGERVLFIDNDAAFMEGAPPKELARNVARVETTAKFSRSFVARLRTVDPAKAFGGLADGTPLLPDAMVKTVRERVAKLLTIIDAKSDEAFP